MDFFFLRFDSGRGMRMMINFLIGLAARRKYYESERTHRW